MQQNEQNPVRVVVELMSPADVKRLDDSDDDIRKQIKELERKLEGLHRTIYDVMEALGRLRDKRN